MGLRFSAAILSVCSSVMGGEALAQAADNVLPVVASPATPQHVLSAQQLDQLVAPVALYPDPVLTDILAAATYPAEIVEAQRFIADPANAGLQGTALTDAASRHDWDASVMALLMFPAVLQMMDSNLEWTEHLGRAFMAQQADVMNAVQRLRAEAQLAGTLRNGVQENVVNEGGTIQINPPSWQQVYLPSYQAECVYGPDPRCDATDEEISWAPAIFLPYGFRPWGVVDWDRREIRLDRDGANNASFTPGYADARFGAQTTQAGIWRHVEHQAQLANRIKAAAEPFNYAPPANAPMTQPRFAAPRGTAMALPGHPVFRAAIQRAPVITAPRGAVAPHFSTAISRR
jgi:hypothetical protein